MLASIRSLRRVSNLRRPGFETLEDRLALSPLLWIELGDPAAPLVEGAEITLNAQVTGVIETPLFEWRIDGEVVLGVSVSTCSFIPPDDGQHNVSVSLISDLGLSADITLDVGNAPPVANVRGPTGGVAGQPLTFILSASDADSDASAGFIFQVDWDGDGVVDEIIPPTADNGAGVAVTHVFESTGEFAVSVTATDKDGGVSEPATIDVAIATFALVEGILYIGGTTADDRIEIAPRGNAAAAPADLTVTANGTTQVFHGVRQIIVYAQAGNDSIDVGARVAVSATLHGNDGNDRLVGGRGVDVLVGGRGDDLLIGRGNRDVLLGGDGADRLFGLVAQDIVIAGVYQRENDPQALASLRAAWKRRASFKSRVARLRKSGALGPGTVADDGDPDQLKGGPGRDWFFATLPQDQILDRRRSDRVSS